jgi:hypothetical protein
MFSTLDIFLVLAFLSTIAVTILTQEPSGPEGAVGAWLLLLIPCLFVAVLVFVMVGKELLNFIPGGSLIQFVTAVGILITFSIAIFGTVDRHQYNWVIQGLVITVPSLILVACAVIIHQTDFPNPKFIHLLAAIILGAAALTGWGLAAKGIFHYMKNEVERANQQVQKEREQQDQREQWEIAEYAKLADSPSLYSLLQFVWSRNDQIRKQAREKVSSVPQLDEKLIELIDQDSEEAITYLAKVYENPPAKFAPAWGKMLERQLKKWDSLQYDEHAGTWENNLKGYFEGAKKIQIAGGSLHTELMAWHEHLLKCKGLGNLTAFVKSLLKTNTKS